MLMEKIHNKKQELILVAKKYGATDIRVFGSVARYNETESSDIDILVSFPIGYDMFKQRIPLQEELSNIIGKTVDLVVEHEINKHLKNIILKEAKDL